MPKYFFPLPKKRHYVKEKLSTSRSHFGVEPERDNLFIIYTVLYHKFLPQILTVTRGREEMPVCSAWLSRRAASFSARRALWRWVYEYLIQKNDLFTFFLSALLSWVITFIIVIIFVVDIFRLLFRCCRFKALMAFITCLTFPVEIFLVLVCFFWAWNGGKKRRKENTEKYRRGEKNKICM